MSGPCARQPPPGAPGSTLGARIVLAAAAMKMQPGEALWQAGERESAMLAKAFQHRMEAVDASVQESFSVLSMMIAEICVGTARHDLSTAQHFTMMLSAAIGSALPSMCEKGTYA